MRLLDEDRTAKATAYLGLRHAKKRPFLNRRPLSASASRNAILSPPQPARVGHPVLAFLEVYSSKIRDRHDSDPVRTQGTIYFPENNSVTTGGAIEAILVSQEQQPTET